MRLFDIFWWFLGIDQPAGTIIKKSQTPQTDVADVAYDAVEEEYFEIEEFEEY